MVAAATALLLPSVALGASTARFAGASSTLATGNCTDQSNPCTLPYALSKSTDGDDLTVLPGTYNLTAPLSSAAEVNLHGLAGASRPLIVAVPGFNLPIIFSSGGGNLRHLAFSSSSGDGYVLDLTVPAIEDISVTANGVTGGGVLLRQGTAETTLRNSTVSVKASPNAPGSKAVAPKSAM